MTTREGACGPHQHPAAAIARRKALTAALRPKFREVGKLLVKMDRLVLRFRRTEAGTLFAATWQAARTSAT